MKLTLFFSCNRNIQREHWEKILDTPFKWFYVLIFSGHKIAGGL